MSHLTPSPRKRRERYARTRDARRETRDPLRKSQRGWGCQAGHDCALSLYSSGEFLYYLLIKYWVGTLAPRVGRGRTHPALAASFSSWRFLLENSWRNSGGSFSLPGTLRAQFQGVSAHRLVIRKNRPKIENPILVLYSTYFHPRRPFCAPLSPRSPGPSGVPLTTPSGPEPLWIHPRPT